MAAPRKYPEELRERAVRMAVDARRDPVTRPGALQRVGEQLGINPETLRVGSARLRSTPGTGSGPRPVTPSAWSSWSGRTVSCAARTPILRSASACFAAELDRPQR